VGSLLVVGQDCSLEEALRMIAKNQAVATEWAPEPPRLSNLTGAVASIADDPDLRTATLPPTDTATTRRGRPARRNRP
jgi:hypothetical protein